MTRKRFVKLVMSCGHDRNYANARAKGAMLLYKSYQRAWIESTDLRVIHGFKVLANAITPVIMSACQSIKEIFKSIGPIVTPLVSVDMDGGENDDRSYAGSSPEVDAADLPGDEEHGAPVEQAKHSGTVLS